MATVRLLRRLFSSSTSEKSSIGRLVLKTALESRCFEGCFKGVSDLLDADGVSSAAATSFQSRSDFAERFDVALDAATAALSVMSLCCNRVGLDERASGASRLEPWTARMADFLRRAAWLVRLPKSSGRSVFDGLGGTVRVERRLFSWPCAPLERDALDGLDERSAVSSATVRLDRRLLSLRGLPLGSTNCAALDGLDGRSGESIATVRLLRTLVSLLGSLPIPSDRFDLRGLDERGSTSTVRLERTLVSLLGLLLDPSSRVAREGLDERVGSSNGIVRLDRRLFSLPDIFDGLDALCSIGSLLFSLLRWVPASFVRMALDGLDERASKATV
jgi:hypothetical protein